MLALLWTARFQIKKINILSEFIDFHARFSSGLGRGAVALEGRKYPTVNRNLDLTKYLRVNSNLR